MMDQTTFKPLTYQVQECLDAKWSIEDGSLYVGLNHKRFSLITRLIYIRDQHTDPQVRSKAKDHLDEIDKNGGIDTATYQVAYRFSMVNQINVKPHRHKADKGMRRLNLFERNRIKELIARIDLSEDESSELKRIQASIVEDKIASVDYGKLKQISIKYYPPKVTPTKGVKHGWTKMDDKTYNDIQALLDRPDVSDADKKRTFQLLDGMKDGKIQTINYFDIGKILADNRASKKERAKRSTASKIFENAVFMACQACDNLDDMKIPVLPKTNRVELVAKISWAAGNLLRLQHQLLHEGEEEESDDGRYQGSVRSDQESLSDLAPIPAPVCGEPRKKDSS